MLKNITSLSSTATTMSYFCSKSIDDTDSCGKGIRGQRRYELDRTSERSDGEVTALAKEEKSVMIVVRWAFTHGRSPYLKDSAGRLDTCTFDKDEAE